MADWEALNRQLLTEVERYIGEMESKWMKMMDAIPLSVRLEDSTYPLWGYTVRLCHEEEPIAIARLYKTSNLRSYLSLLGENRILQSVRIHLSEETPKRFEPDIILARDVGSLLACHAFFRLAKAECYLNKPKFFNYLCYIVDGAGNITLSITYRPKNDFWALKYIFYVEFPNTMKRPFKASFVTLESKDGIERELSRGIVSDNISFPRDIYQAFEQFHSFLSLVLL